MIRSFIVVKAFHVGPCTELNVFYLSHSISMCETFGKIAIRLEGNLGSSYWDLLPLNNVYVRGVGLDFVKFLCNEKSGAFVNSLHVSWPQTVPLSFPSF